MPHYAQVVGYLTPSFMKIHCLIVDDEPLALDIIEDYLKRFDQFVIIDKCTSAVAAFNVLQRQKIDLMFLDIQMPKLTGLELIKNISNPPWIIITSAFSNYALESFDLDVIDYLLKPISFERFLKAMNKVLRLKNNVTTELAPAATEQAGEAVQDAYIYVKADKLTMKVFLKDILYVESQRNYVKIQTTQREIISYISISQIEERLPENKFMRIHRSFIVAKNKIEAFSSHIVVIGKHQIPIGRNFRMVAMKAFEGVTINETREKTMDAEED